jgi:hypothetical protein
MRGTSRNSPYEVSLAFAPVDGGTRVDVESAFHLSGVMKLIGPLFIGPTNAGGRAVCPTSRG